MRLSLFGLIFLLFMNVAARSQVASDNKSSLTRAQSVINAFQVMCARELPNFEHIDANAAAMRMQLQDDNKTPSPGNTVTHSKSWMGSLTTGPFLLFLDEMSGAKGTSTSCAIVGDVPDLDAFRADLVIMMLLPAVPPPETHGDGSRSFIWDGILGPGTTLILRDFKPSGKPGVMLKLLSMIGRR
jgi:hypothetical protein